MSDSLTSEVTCSLGEMRASRDASVRLAQRKVDEAKLFEALAQLRRAESKIIIDEVNENVPVPQDN